ncbi:MAG: hypothetical protein AVDCRST_MAG95-1268 [uncultured Adhaeribacter sp.]|uniref:Insertion element IS402-like domain-containing protein n=1 Tax=uncultured Adhaeribacter sp. TaxID=448109 RepID=A0A6J4I0Z7_9BACT|nr:MAG: hypothetical protein AVDCRST_MAG95-1268 [uncultured Adhaeribacter sp.]
MADAIFYVLRVGNQWRNLPEAGFAKWQLVYYYFRRWKADGTLERLNWRLKIKQRERQGKPASPSLMSIDGQTIKTAPFIQQQTGIDGNKKLNGRKLTRDHGCTRTSMGNGAHCFDGAMARRVVAPLRGYL